jgi:glycosyltransferase involved in cell wall biosynthesis
MRIAIDALGMEMAGGGRFTALSLIEGILQEDRENHYLIFVSSEEDCLRQFPNAQQWVVRARNRFAARVKAQVLFPRLLRRERVDIMHFIKNLGAFFLPCKTLVSVYDLTILAYSEFFPRIDVLYWRTLQALFLRRVDKVAVLSENTKRDVLEYYRLPGEKIDVIYSACDPSFRPLLPAEVEEIRKKYSLPREYILTVGNISPKKNFCALVKALSLLKQNYGLPHKLVIVGKEYWAGGQRPLRALVSELGLQGDVIFLGTIVGRDLVALYNAATLFAFPSLHEGFGIVLLEAMSSGVPVVASGTSAIPEVVGDAGILLSDPQDEVELAKAMALVINDEARRQSMIAQGFKRAGQFSWRKAGAQYVQLYERLARGSLVGHG